MEGEKRPDDDRPDHFESARHELSFLVRSRVDEWNG
jgi:hypothetical protein